MSKYLNIINGLLAYDEKTINDNPVRRSFDWSRRLHNIPITDPVSSQEVIAPNDSLTLFDGTHSVVNPPTDLSIASLVGNNSLYRLSTSNSSTFRQLRAISGIVGCDVTINNNVVAIFNFATATLTGVVAGDTMRINGIINNDTGPFTFSASNAGYWKVIAVNGTQVQVVRPDNEPLDAIAETVAAVSSNVKFFSSSGIQVGDKVSITGTLSSLSQRIYEVSSISDNSIDFLSSQPLPIESTVSYVASSLSFYTNAQRLLYIEADQECTIRLNDDTSSNVKIVPVTIGDPLAPGFFNIWGSIYKAVIVNNSINPVNVFYIVAQ